MPEGVDWISLVEVRDQWRTLVDTAVNVRGALRAVKATSEELQALHAPRGAQ